METAVLVKSAYWTRRWEHDVFLKPSKMNLLIVNNICPSEVAPMQSGRAGQAGRCEPSHPWRLGRRSWVPWTCSPPPSTKCGPRSGAEAMGLRG